MASSLNSNSSAAAGPSTPAPASNGPVAARGAWNRGENGSVPAVVPPVSPIMDAESWPSLPGLVTPPPTTPPPMASPPQAAPSPSTEEVVPPISLGNPGAPDANPDHDTPVRSPPTRRAPVMPAEEGVEKIAPGPEPSPVYSPNARTNGGGDHHQNGRFGSHSHGRGGGYGTGSRRGNGGGGGRHGPEHHGGFDGQRRGGGRSRDGHGPGRHQHRAHQPSFIRPPPPPPFVSPATSHTPPYVAPMVGFSEMAPQFYYGLPLVPHPAAPSAMLIPAVEPQRIELLKQIEYYFSNANLCKDIWLRQQMDDQGWVPLSLIAGFNQVKKLTSNPQFILETVLLSGALEAQVDKIRRRDNWQNWLLPRPNYSAGDSSGSLSPVTSNVDSLASQFQSVGFEGAYHPSLQGMNGEALITRSGTSVSLGYQAPTLGGLYSNGSGPLFGQNSARSLLRSDTF